MSLPEIFSSETSYRSFFYDGLVEMIRKYPQPGTWILVAANAFMEKEYREFLDVELQMSFTEIGGKIRDSLLAGDTTGVAEDDLLVFLQILLIGYSNLRSVERRRIDAVWDLQFNPLRALRPPRTAQQQICWNHAPYQPDMFNFNLPFLRKEVLWEGELEGRMVEMLYNKFPFVTGHALLVPEREHDAPQYLGKGDHRHIWKVAETLGSNMDGFGVGYNSYGAYASVNHLHFQCFIQKQFPIEAECWSHNGGEQIYPVEVIKTHSEIEAWEYILQLQSKGVSFNLLYRPKTIYIIPRGRQGEVPLSQWNSGMAWYELCGGFVTFNQRFFSSLESADILKEIKDNKIYL